MSIDDQAITPRRRRTRRWVIGIALLLTATGAVALVYRHYSDSERVRLLATAYLQRFVAGEVSIGSASFSLVDGLRLYDVRVSEPASPGKPNDADPADRTVFSCREIEVTHDPWSALVGRLRIETLIALEPSCVIVHDRESGKTNLASLWPIDPRTSPTAPQSLPTIELRNARIRVRSRDAGRVRDVEDLTLTVRGRSADHDPKLYDIVWHEREGDRAGGHSQLDLETGFIRNVRGGLPRMSIEAVMMVVNAGYDGAAAWSELLGLGGQVRAIDYNLTDASDLHGPRSATIELLNASISIPISAAEQRFPRSQRYLRFVDVRGSIIVRSDEIEASFTGDLHGSRCEVSGSVRFASGRPLSLDDVDFDAHLSITGLDFPRADAAAPPEEARFVNHWAPLAMFFRDYDPRGRVDADVRVNKRAGEPIRLQRAMLTGRGGEIRCRFFPYPVHNTTGTVEFSSEGVFIRNVRGEREGGVLTLEGQLDEPSACAEAEITIRGFGVPLDETLFAALPGGYREPIDHLHPAGRADFEVKLKRPRCVDGRRERWDSETSVTFTNVSATYDGFAYPVDAWSGEIHCDRNRIELRNLSGVAGDTTIGLDGRITLQNGKPSSLELNIRAKRVPVDDKLMQALPGHLRTVFAEFAPEGIIDVATTVVMEDNATTITHDTVVTMRGVSLRHVKMPLSVTELHGDLVMSSDRVAFTDLAGQCAGGSLTANGNVTLGPGSHGGDIELQVTGLRPDEAFHKALPTLWRERIESWRVGGPVDVSIRATATSTDGDPEWTVSATVRVDGVDVEHPFFPVPLRDVTGTLDFAKHHVRSDGLQAQYGGGSLDANFEIEQTPSGPIGQLSIIVTDLPLDNAVRDLCPPQLSAVWDRLEPQGKVDLVLRSIRLEPGDALGESTWSVDGSVRLHDVTLRGIDGVNGASGTIHVGGMVIDRKGGTALSGKITASQMVARGRQFNGFDSEWSLLRTANGAGRLALTSAQADLYDGSITGDVELLFDADSARYSLSTTLQGVRLRPLLGINDSDRAEVDAPSTKKQTTKVNGLVDANAYLAGEVGRPESRRGGGRIEIVDGHLYELPILAAILHVLNLSIPRQDTLEEADASFFLVGDELELTDIGLRGAALSLVGNGTMSLPDFGVDLHLINVNPNDWARLPALTEFMEGASAKLIELHVTGPIGAPTVRTKALRSLGDEFKRLFQIRKPTKARQASN